MIIDHEDGPSRQRRWR